VAEIVLENHPVRRRNPGPADWLVEGGRLMIAYNWPDQGDATIARVVTLWPQR
jgi:hypothetical protein